MNLNQKTMKLYTSWAHWKNQCRTRSSHQRCSARKGVLRNSAKSTGKHLCHTGLRPATSLKKRLWHRCFLVNFVKFLRTLFYRTPPGDCFSRTNMSMLYYETSMNIDILLTYLLKTVENIFNPFHGTGLFLYSLKYMKKPEVSWSFQRAWKETWSTKWVKSHLIFSYLFCYWYK